MNKLYLHIGTAKTGTTSIQNFLLDHQDFLKENSFSYLDLKKIDNKDIKKNIPKIANIKGNGYVVLRSILYEGKWGKKNIDYLWGIINSELTHNNLIISEENIWDTFFDMETEDIIKVIKEKVVAELVVIIYLRRQDLYQNSYREQLIKGNMFTKSMKEFLEWNKNDDYLGKLRKIEAIVGKENIIVRPFEVGQFRGNNQNVVDDFLDSLGLQFLGDTSTYRDNEGLYGGVSEIKYLFNIAYRDKSDYKLNWEQNCVLSNILKKLNKSEFAEQRKNVKFDCQLLEKYKKTYEENNSVIARYYLGRKDGVLFYDNDSMKGYESIITDREKLIIDVFAEMIAYMKNEIIILEKREEYYEWVKKHPFKGLYKYIRKLF